MPDSDSAWRSEETLNRVTRKIVELFEARGKDASAFKELLDQS